MQSGSPAGASAAGGGGGGGGGAAGGGAAPLPMLGQAEPDDTMVCHYTLEGSLGAMVLLAVQLHSFQPD